MSTRSAREKGVLDDFVSVSAALTGFSVTELQATGLTTHYLAVLATELGEERVAGLLRTIAGAPDPAALADPEAKECAHALTYLWYVGVWPGRAATGGPYVVSPRAYAEGLVWKTFHGAPPGTVAPGFGSWARPPRGTAA
ncbi:hypothetical protein ACIA8K_25255 [Catenuloplanes sp. NPDC051500]|uniref:hypothetical protein n=1 Tax=Catenuloplanes sp. NPDC051500 TaxID=3363959 RepID=UPI0037A04CCC